ncbi:MAG: sulfite exporter TauE/SafE family protein [Oscillospiraceae bacterium]|jgi:uncharacterized membrane protein YfcA|nr:sulfite exporter TauE/SafE family protein [Oscillospiraceae bacterium]
MIGVLIAGIAGLVSGIVSAWGVGGGTILLTYIAAFTDTKQHDAQGINLLYFLPSAAIALITHIKNRMIMVRPVLVTAAFGVPTAVLCSLLSLRIEGELMRKIFGGFLVVVGVFMFFQKSKKGEAVHRVG